MAIKINNTTVIDNSRKGFFDMMHIGTYTQAQLEVENPVIVGQYEGDAVYCTDRNEFVFWDAAENRWNLPVPPSDWWEIIPSNWALAMDFSNSTNGGLFADSRWTSISQQDPIVQTIVDGPFDRTTNVLRGSGATNNNYFRMGNFDFLPNSSKKFCLSVWYRGTDSLGQTSYDPGVPVFGDTRGSVYGGLGMHNGRISYCNASTLYNGSIVVNDNSWHMLTYRFIGRRLTFFVDGVLDNNINSISTPSNNWKCSDIGAHYPYRSNNYPRELAYVTAYDREVSDAEILELYNAFK